MSDREQEPKFTGHRISKEELDEIEAILEVKAQANRLKPPMTYEQRNKVIADELAQLAQLRKNFPENMEPGYFGRMVDYVSGKTDEVPDGNQELVQLRVISSQVAPQPGGGFYGRMLDVIRGKLPASQLFSRQKK